MSLFTRVQAILLRPKATWPVIAAENTDAKAIYSNYLIALAAIPAIAGFIRTTIVGIDVVGVGIRVPLVTGIVRMLVTYALTLMLVYLLSLIVNGLAPTFGGTRNGVAALKVVAYSATASFVASILGIVPALGVLGGLVGLAYSIYLLYTGLPVLMRTPAAKAGPYTGVVLLCEFVCGLVVVAVFSLVLSIGPTGGAGLTALGFPGGAGSVVIKTPDGTTATIDPGAMNDVDKRIAEAGKRMEAAQSAGDSAAAGKAMGDVMGVLAAMAGGSAPVAATDLKSMLPETAADLRRQSFEATGGQALGIAGSTAKATYGEGGRRIDLSITDTGGLAGVAAMAGLAGVTMDKESDGQVEKVYKDGARTVHEQYRKDGSRGEMTVILGNGIVVAAEGRHMDMATLKSVIAGIDVARLEAMKRVAKPAQN